MGYELELEAVARDLDFLAASPRVTYPRAFDRCWHERMMRELTQDPPAGSDRWGGGLSFVRWLSLCRSDMFAVHIPAIRALAASGEWSSALRMSRSIAAYLWLYGKLGIVGLLNSLHVIGAARIALGCIEKLHVMDRCIEGKDNPWTR